MNYDKIHNEYRLGLGLYFKLSFGHNSHPNGMICFSNIPGLNLRKLNAVDESAAVNEVREILECELGIVQIN